jgi:histidinol phosphatase-like PHP family hydrolase
MVTVFRKAGLRIVIYTDDHPPAHVHVYGDGETKIILSGSEDQPAILSTRRSSYREASRALEIVTANRVYLLQRWSEFHG